jgi:hypothetical protein
MVIDAMLSGSDEFGALVLLARVPPVPLVSQLRKLLGIRTAPPV